MTSPSVMALIWCWQCGQGAAHGEHQMTGCDWWRIAQPLQLLQDRGVLAGWAWTSEEREVRHLADVEGAHFDVALVARAGFHTDAWVEFMQRRESTVVYDVDDDLFSPESTDHLLETVHRGKPRANIEADRQARIYSLNICDGVTVTTEALAAIARRYTPKPVHVVPNAIDLAWWRDVQRQAPRVSEGLTVGWSGAMRPEADVEVMAWAWGRIARRYPGVTFAVHGSTTVLDVVGRHVPPERIRYVPYLALGRYPRGLAGIDIGCAPLADTPFNACKSPIKAMEYAASGAAVVASPLVYGELIETGSDGLLCETPAQWEGALCMLIERPAVRAMMARRLLRKVERHHALDRQIGRWPAAWAQIIAAARLGVEVAV